MLNPVYLLLAVVAGWGVQALLTYRQSQAFRRQAHSLRTLGTVSVGVGGRRYRGGRAFVALAFDQTGQVQGGLVLRGFTTFSRPRPLDQVTGRRAGPLAGLGPLPGLRPNEREACRQAAQLWKRARHRQSVTSERPVTTTSSAP